MYVMPMSSKNDTCAHVRLNPSLAQASTLYAGRPTSGIRAGTRAVTDFVPW